MVSNDLILLTLALPNLKFPCLVGVHYFLGVMYGYENILFLFYNFISFIVVSLFCLAALGGPYPLLLVVHVPFLCFFGIREMLAHILDIYEWPRQVIPLTYGFDP